MTHQPPPSAPQFAKADVAWAGKPHHAVCVKIHNGTTSIAVHGVPGYELYTAPKSAYAYEVPGKLTIVTPDAPHSDGTACLVIANEEPAHPAVSKR